jgi:hypothetical protein
VLIGYFKLLAGYSFLGRLQIRCSEMMMAGVQFGKRNVFFCRRVSTATHRTALDFARESGSLEVVEALKRYSQPQAWGLVDMYHLLPPFKRSFKIFKLNWFLQRLANSEMCVRPCIPADSIQVFLEKLQ